MILYNLISLPCDCPAVCGDHLKDDWFTCLKCNKAYEIAKTEFTQILMLPAC